MFLFPLAAWMLSRVLLIIVCPCRETYNFVRLSAYWYTVSGGSIVIIMDFMELIHLAQTLCTHENFTEADDCGEVELQNSLGERKLIQFLTYNASTTSFCFLIQSA